MSIEIRAESSSRWKSISGPVAIAVVVLLAGIAAGWALATIFGRPNADLVAHDYTSVGVIEGTVGESLTLNAAVEWPAVPAGTNQMAGTVTSVDVVDGELVDAGVVLYSVNLRPVTLAQGDVPAFRSLGRGDSGADVAQLQRFLTTMGFYRGAVDATFGYATVQAVRAWQKQLAVPSDGTVQVGDLVYVPSVPARVALDRDVIARGVTLSGGVVSVYVLPSAPDFSLPVTEAQSSLMPSGTEVELTGPQGQVWRAVAGSRVAKEGVVTVKLESLDGQSICVDQCGTISPVGTSLIASRIVIVPDVSGYVVPTAALVSGPNAAVSVVTDGGSTIPVTVLASAHGEAVIEGGGIGPGVHVRIPARE